MSKKVTIWQTWSSQDPGESDFFHTSRGAAEKHLRAGWDVKRGSEEPYGDAGFKLTVGDNLWVYAVPHELEMTKDGVCKALTELPSR